MTNRLPSATKRAIGTSNGLRIGTVISVDPGEGIVVDIGGGRPDNVGVTAGYRPVPGDTVALFRQDTSWLILDRITGGADAAVSGGKSLVFDRKATVATITNLTAVEQLLPGTEISVVVPADGCDWEATISIDFQALGATATTGVVSLSIDGVIDPLTPQAIYNQGTSGSAARVTAAAFPFGVLNKGTYVMQLSAKRVGGADLMMRANNIHSSLGVKVWR